MRRINDDGKNVRVVNHAGPDAVPALATVVSLPRQVPRTGVDHRWIDGINGHGFNVLDLCMVCRRDALPVVSAVAAAEHAVQGARYKGPRVRWGQRQRANGFSPHAGESHPGLAAVAAAKEVAVIVR